MDGRTLPLVRRADGYEAELPPRTGPGKVRVAVGSLLERHFVVPPSASAELSVTGIDRAALLRLAGAPERLDPPAEQALVAPRKMEATTRPLSLPFLLIAAILLPLDAWARRRTRYASP